MTRILNLALFVVILLILSGCVSPQNNGGRITDVTNEAEWWGQLAPNRIVRLKTDVLVGPGSLLQTQAYIAHSDYHDETVTIDQYKADPEKWPSLKIISSGITLQCLHLERYYRFESSRYKLDAKVLDGELSGRIVDIGWWLTFGSPNEKGSLRLDPKYLKPVK